MALRVVEAIGEARHPDTDRLESMGAELARLAAATNAPDFDGASEADLVDQIALLERLRSAIAAAQAGVMVRFAHARVDAELAAGADPGLVGRGVVEEIALACRTSPPVAARRLSAARAWTVDLPETFSALTAGQLSEQVAETVVSETRHLDGRTRREVDAAVVASGIAGMGIKQATWCVRRHAYQADPAGYVDRGRHERKHRRVGLRPAPDTMAVLTAYLPVEQGVACLAALRQHTDAVVGAGDREHVAAGDRPRSRDQVMADTLVERLTGQAHATDVPVEIQIVLPAELAADATSGRTATLSGGGPLPGPLVHQIVGASRGRKRSRIVWASPAGRPVGIDRTRRRFIGSLADLITARDQTCRAPSCDAAIRQHDHVRPWARGGPTTAINGQGLCERHNQTKETHGWATRVVHDGLGDQPHTIETITPTGHVYQSRAPDPP